MKLGIALAGGGIRGIAHAGVLKALEEENIKIDIIGGTSAGGLVASLYAMGYSPYYIYALFKRYAKKIVKIDQISVISEIGNVLINKNLDMAGLCTGEKIEKSYNDLAENKGVKCIREIKNMPLVIPAVDVMKSKEYVFTNNIPNDVLDKTQYITDITIGKAVRASSSLPRIFLSVQL